MMVVDFLAAAFLVVVFFLAVVRRVVFFFAAVFFLVVVLRAAGRRVVFFLVFFLAMVLLFLSRPWEPGVDPPVGRCTIGGTTLGWAGRQEPVPIGGIGWGWEDPDPSGRCS